MKHELCWIFAFNLIVNSLLSFFTSFCLIELLLFWVRHPRMQGGQASFVSRATVKCPIGRQMRCNYRARDGTSHLAGWGLYFC